MEVIYYPMCDISREIISILCFDRSELRATFRGNEIFLTDPSVEIINYGNSAVDYYETLKYSEKIGIDYSKINYDQRELIKMVL